MQATDLLQRVMDYRPNDVLPRRGLLSIQEAMRRVCKETLLLQYQLAFDLQSGVTATGFTPNITPVQTVGMAQEMVYTFPQQAITGKKQTDGITTDTNVYSVIRCQNVWIRDQIDFLTYDYDKPLNPMPWPLLMERASHSIYTPSSVTTPSIWADKFGQLSVWPPVAGVQPIAYDHLTMTACLLPQGEFNDLNLPYEAEDAVMEFAAAFILRINGEGKNMQESNEHLQSALNLCGGLRGMNQVGTSGDPGYYGTAFDFKVRG